MSKSRGNVDRPVDGARRRAAPTRCAGTCSPRARRGRRSGCRIESIDESTQPVPADALEHVLVLRHLREPRRLGRPAPRRALADRTCSTAGSARGCTRTVARRSPTRSRGSTRCAAAQALERFVDDLSNWYVRRSRPRFWKAADAGAHATLHECLAHGHAAARAVLPVRRRRAVPQPRAAPTSRCTWPTGPRSTRPAIDADARGARWSVARAGRVARPRGPHRGQAQGAPAAAPRARAPARRRALSDAVAVAEIADALNVKRRRGGHRPRRPARLRGRPELPGARPAASASCMPLVKDALARRRRRRPSSRALDERRRATTLDCRRRDGRRSSPTTSRCAPRHTRSSRSPQDGGYAVALDTTLDDDLRAEGIARERRPRASTTCARPTGSRSPTGSLVRAARRRRPARGASNATGSGSRARCLAKELDPGPDRTGRRGHDARRSTATPVGVEIEPGLTRPRRRSSAAAAEQARPLVRRRPGRRSRRRRSSSVPVPSGASSRTASRSEAKNASSSRSSACRRRRRRGRQFDERGARRRGRSHGGRLGAARRRAAGRRRRRARRRAAAPVGAAGRGRGAGARSRCGGGAPQIGTGLGARRRLARGRAPASPTAPSATAVEPRSTTTCRTTRRTCCRSPPRASGRRRRAIVGTRRPMAVLNAAERREVGLDRGAEPRCGTRARTARARRRRRAAPRDASRGRGSRPRAGGARTRRCGGPWPRPRSTMRPRLRLGLLEHLAGLAGPRRRRRRRHAARAAACAGACPRSRSRARPAGAPRPCASCSVS